MFPNSYIFFNIIPIGISYAIPFIKNAMYVIKLIRDGVLSEGFNPYDKKSLKIFRKSVFFASLKFGIYMIIIYTIGSIAFEVIDYGNFIFSIYFVIELIVAYIILSTGFGILFYFSMVGLERLTYKNAKENSAHINDKKNKSEL